MKDNWLPPNYPFIGYESRYDDFHKLYSSNQFLLQIGSKSCCQVRFISTAVTIETVKLRTDKRTREIHPDVVRKYVRSLIKKLQEGNCENMFLSQEVSKSLFFNLFVNSVESVNLLERKTVKKIYPKSYYNNV